MKALGTATQDHGIARLEAQGGRIRRHVRPTLVNDADDAERHRHALNCRPFGRSHSASTVPSGSCRSATLRSRRHRLDSCGIEHQPIEHCAAQAALLAAAMSIAFAARIVTSLANAAAAAAQQCRVRASWQLCQTAPHARRTPMRPSFRNRGLFACHSLSNNTSSSR